MPPSMPCEPVPSLESALEDAVDTRLKPSDSTDSLPRGSLNEKDISILMQPCCWPVLRPSIRPSVRPTVRPSVRLSVRPSIRPSQLDRPSFCSFVSLMSLGPLSLHSQVPYQVPHPLSLPPQVLSGPLSPVPRPS